MRAHYLQHVPFEGLGNIDAWLQNAGYEITCTQFYNSEELPEIENIDFLIIMGGPMSVNDEQVHPWLVKEKKFIRGVIELGKPTLGICLGAQLIANSLGAEVFPNTSKEIGWFPIQAVKSVVNGVFQFPEEVIVFHWHGETFSLPSGALRIAESKVCRNQAFQIGRKVLGLQFHLETTASSARLLVENCREELVDEIYIQSETEILATPRRRYRTANRLMEEILEYLHANNEQLA